MPNNKYYYYDHELCSFVEVSPKRGQTYLRRILIGVVAFLLAGGGLLGLNAFVGTPEELALQAENRALRQQLDATQERIDHLATELDVLSTADQELYRTLLGADPISSDVRQVGVGGADRYEAFDRFSTSTAKLLRTTTQQLDELERRVSLQNESYRELSRLAETHNEALTQLPALLPTDGELVSGFGMRYHPILRIKRMHKGVDFSAQTGTPIFATGDGVVEFAGRGSGYGKHVIIRHAKAGYKTLYAHLSDIDGSVREGRSVHRGQQIGRSGNTGLSKAPHLHYEVRNLDDKAVNPIYFFAPSVTPQEYRTMLEVAERDGMSLD
ncbi:MAG: peptidoglycan DD-metalloendopeptidase family protein [Bacteroidetes bacterium]|jgi:murein DD-endopeptidase MepM/ murein hydrolase activator NlpD|nr:peptidoglycan DD-metalloendopeptidase family protein [Bacteroidota bacterium]